MLDTTESTAVTEPTTQPSTATTSTTIPGEKTKKRKKKSNKPHTLTQTTLRQPQWTYIHLRHKPATKPPYPTLDAVTAHLHILAALQQFLGLHGSAIAFDILKVDDQDVWIRVQKEDERAVVAAVGGWISNKGEGSYVVSWGAWDVDGGGDGGNLFE